MTVSIVMPAFNAARFVGTAIDSVLAQSLPDWELIVVDDGSTDATGSEVERFRDQRIRLVREVHSGLPAVARNRGIAESSGTYVAFLDADDAWLPAKLERQLAVFASSPTVGLVHCAASYLDESGFAPRLMAEPADTLLALLQENFIYNSSVVVRRPVLDEHGVFDTDPALRGAEDYELWLRLAPVVEFTYVPERLLLYRRHGDGVSADEPRNRAAGIVARERVREREPGLYAALRPAFARSVGISRCLAGMPGSGRRDLLLALRSNPRDFLAWKWLLLALVGSKTAARLRRALRR
jgi:glycosyltransferase involved in cell wall biosynthesis